MEIYWQNVVSWLWTYAPKVVLALLFLLIGLRLIKILDRLLRRSMEKRDVDVSLRHFLSSFVKIGLRILLIISVIGMAGIRTTSFIAMIGAAGLAIGLALQGSLANFAGGVLILLLKPYKVGDFIAANGNSGTVKEIQIFYTVLITPQNQKVIIPNSLLSNNTVLNYSTEATRRMDLVFSIGYEDDIDKAKETLNSIIEEESMILKEPEPQVFVEELAESSVNLRTRFWTATEDFWNVHNKIKEQVKKSFDQQGITIPFPQSEIRYKKEDQN